MPLLKRRPVPILPVPFLDGIPQDAEVFFLKATGEIFLDYESYSARLSYLLSRIFQCEFSGKTNLDYFSALESEKAESRVVRERFPDELKGRVLASVQFQVMGRLDALVDLVYERYKDRYFGGEKVFVDLAGDKYFARISKVFPPSPIRALARAAPQPTPVASTSTLTPASSLSPPPTSQTNGEPVDEFAAFVHKIGTDLNNDPDDARKEDDPEDYLYTVQLMDEEHKFEGSFMEVQAKALSRDRLAFSKSILKRYIRECVQRDALIASPWIVKPAIALAFGIPQHQSQESEERNKQIREGKLAKRRKTKDDPEPGPSKRRKSGNDYDSTPLGDRKPHDPKRPIKYPIEDLDLDPMSIHDGRILRRVNSELPTLPPKPVPNRDLLVPASQFDSFITIWNMLNVFSKPLSLSTFSLDDFASALHHNTLDPRCILLAEMHACLTNVIATDTSRVLGSTGAPPVPTAPSSAVDDAGAEAEDEEDEFDKLIRKGMAHSKRWDRMAKLKSADGREGWERHLIGALCQRGGPISMPNLPRILRHLFEGADFSSPKPVPEPEPEPEETDEITDTAQITEIEEPIIDTSHPEAQYLTLALEDKLDILEYLVTLALGSKLVRSFIDQSESQLTEFRKHRADVNKERRSLLEQKATIEGGAVKTEGAETSLHPSAHEASVDHERNGNGALNPPGSDMAVDEPLHENDDDDEEDQLADDDEVADEDLSENDSENAASGGADGVLSARRAALEEKRVERKASEAARTVELAKARIEAKAKTAGRRQADRARGEFEDQIKANSKKDDWVEREFRRFQGVARCRPLGRDRFFNRYWWFDGVGGMNLIGQGAGVLYGAGRLFVQGPSQEDWDLVCGERGEEMNERRKKEEVDPKAMLGVNEWGFYEDEEEIDALQGWLNGKGTRELALKNSLAKWRGYILAGSRRRQADTLTPYQHLDARRSTRSKAEPEEACERYLAYQNKIARV